MVAWRAWESLSFRHTSVSWVGTALIVGPASLDTILDSWTRAGLVGCSRWMGNPFSWQGVGEILCNLYVRTCGSPAGEAPWPYRVDLQVARAVPT